MAISLALLGCGFRSLSALFCAISWYAYIKMPDLEERKKSIQHSQILTINVNNNPIDS